MDVGFDSPGRWLSRETNPDTRDKLDEDFCKIYDDDDIERYIRCVLPFPVQEWEQTFQFGVWMSVSEKSWDIYKQGFSSGEHELKVCFGYLANPIPEFDDSYLLHADVSFRADNSRPIVILHQADSPLVEAQQEGLELSYIKNLMSRFHN